MLSVYSLSCGAFGSFDCILALALSARRKSTTEPRPMKKTSNSATTNPALAAVFGAPIRFPHLAQKSDFSDISHPQETQCIRLHSHPRTTRAAHRLLVLTIPTVSLQRKSTDVTIRGMETSGSGKRTVQVNVKMSDEDFATLQKAANTLWPDAILSNSAIILGLARLAAKDIIKRKPTKPRV